MSFEIKPEIYFNTTMLSEPLGEATQAAKAPQRIGDVWARLRDNLGRFGSEKAVKSLLGRLGVEPTDRHAHNYLIPMIQTACGSNVVITPSENQDETGVYFLSTNGRKFAVFKVGEKRARMELLARQVAHQMGLERHAVPGMFCSISNPQFPRGETVVELWNGNQKVFKNERDDGAYTDSAFKSNDGLDQPYTLTGILEPFIETDKEFTPYDFAMMTYYALIIGLRDGKLSGIAKEMFFDLEECMPPRLLPITSPNKNVAATHLPFLEHPLAKVPMPSELVQALYNQINEMPLDEFLQSLAQQRVEYPDLAAEDLRALDEDLNENGFESFGWDHGGCYVQVEETPIIIKDAHANKQLDQMNPESFRLLSDEQLNTCKTRIIRLRECLRAAIESGRPLTPIDMVRSVDLHYDAQMRALERMAYDRQPVTHVVGRFAPGQIGKLSSPDRRSVMEESESARHPRQNWARALFQEPPAPTLGKRKPDHL